MRLDRDRCQFTAGSVAWTSSYRARGDHLILDKDNWFSEPKVRLCSFLKQEGPEKRREVWGPAATSEPSAWPRMGMTQLRCPPLDPVWNKEQRQQKYPTHLRRFLLPCDSRNQTSLKPERTSGIDQVMKQTHFPTRLVILNPSCTLETAAELLKHTHVPTHVRVPFTSNKSECLGRRPKCQYLKKPSQVILMCSMFRTTALDSDAQCPWDAFDRD